MIILHCNRVIFNTASLEETGAAVLLHHSIIVQKIFIAAYSIQKKFRYELGVSRFKRMKNFQTYVSGTWRLERNCQKFSRSM